MQSATVFLVLGLGLATAFPGKSTSYTAMGTFDYAALVALLEIHWKAPASAEQVIEAFKIFDPDGTGTISSSEMRTVMTNLGEKLTKDEVDAMLKEADPDNSGKIDYAKFVKNMEAQTIKMSN